MKTHAKIRKTRSDRIFCVANNTLLALLTLVFLYPLYFIVIASISDPYSVASGNVLFTPVGFTLDSYRFVFSYDVIWSGYRNTLLYTVFGTLLSLALTVPAAYALSKKELPYRSAFSWYFLFTMYFSGGMIPTYLLIKDMGLLDKPYTLILVSAFSVYNMVVTRIFFSTSIPDELYEAARIDGCSELGTFFKIALPLSAPIVAVMALYYGVARWNSWFDALVYVRNAAYAPLQMVLRAILINNESILQNIDPTTVDEELLRYYREMAYIAQTMKYALIIVASVPLLIAYPFVQKHFVKGMMIGSLKG